jgi:septal ring factor EnvC (AmiA/AmiB activator)
LVWSLSGAAVRAENMDQANSANRLKELDRELKNSQVEHDKAAERAAEIAREEATLRSDLVSAASAVQESEESLTDLEARLKDLDAEEVTKRAALDHTREEMGGVIAALARLAFRPTEALIGQPTSPADTVRTAILLREAVPSIKRSAQALKDDLAGLATVRAAIAAQKAKIAGTAETLDADHRRLAALLAKKAAARQEAEAQNREAQARLAALGSEAADLRDLLARLDAEHSRQMAEKEALEKAEQEKLAKAAQNKANLDKQAEAESRAKAATLLAAPRSFSSAQGRMPMPARGPVLVHFGQINEAGLPAKGISIATRPGAQVVAPYDGQVAFAGPFRGYGLLLIIEHGEGYHTLLAGMARIDSQVGQHLIAGEPVGVMVDSESKPVLYVELRHQGQPINPLPWLSARKSKVGE